MCVPRGQIGDPAQAGVAVRGAGSLVRAFWAFSWQVHGREAGVDARCRHCEGVVDTARGI